MNLNVRGWQAKFVTIHEVKVCVHYESVSIREGRVKQSSHSCPWGSKHVKFAGHDQVFVANWNLRGEHELIRRRIVSVQADFYIAIKWLSLSTNIYLSSSDPDGESLKQSWLTSLEGELAIDLQAFEHWRSFYIIDNVPARLNMNLVTFNRDATGQPCIDVAPEHLSAFIVWCWRHWVNVALIFASVASDFHCRAVISAVD